MFQVMLLNFVKKKNSTVRPDLGTGAVYNGELKDNTNILQPVFLFNFGLDANNKSFNPKQYTYARIAEFGRYYFIENWTWNNGIWIAQMKVDTLATYKEEIGIANLYVLRSASQYNKYIIDTMYPAIVGDVTQVSQQLASPWKAEIGNAPSTADGFYLVGIVNSDSNAIGTTAYYAFSEPAMRGLLHILYDSPSWLNITDVNITADMQKMLFNPIQYITTAMWIPYPLMGSTINDRVTSLPIGWWTVTLQYPCFRLKPASAFYTFSLTIDIPKHPQSMPAGSDTFYREWLNLSPYTQYALEFYPFGMIPIDGAKLIGADSLSLQVKLDYITGKGTLRILKIQRANGSTPTETLTGAIYSTTAQVGIPIAVAAMSVNMSELGQASTWLTAAGATVGNDGVLSSYWNYIKAEWNAASTGDRTGADEAFYHFADVAFGDNSTSIKDKAASIGNAALAIAGTCQSQGATGAFAQYTLPVILTAYILHVATMDNEHFGTPLCEKKVINTLSGFIKVADADSFVAVGCYPNEADIVRAYLEGGFYYE